MGGTLDVGAAEPRPAGAHRRVTLLADGDEPGEQAAMRTGARWKSEGREVRIARPPRGKDFADLLMEEDAS